MTSPPAEVAQRQLDAYNARDLDAFLACYTDDAVITDDAGAVVVAGGAAFRSFYEQRFADWYPVALAGRLVAGHWAVDHETGTPAGGVAAEVIIALHVTDGLIDRVVVLSH